MRCRHASEDLTHPSVLFQVNHSVAAGAEGNFVVVVVVAACCLSTDKVWSGY
jgi:hypothetical protein